MMGKKIEAIWQGLVPGAPEKAKRVPLRSFPVVMRKELIHAIQMLEFWVAEYRVEQDWKALLDVYRGNKSAGVMNPHFLMNMNRVYPALAESLERVDNAFDAMHNYNPAEHLSEGVYREVQKRNAAQDRPKAKKREALLKLIGAWLAKKGYKESADKEALISAAIKEFKLKGCKRTDVTDAARLANLTRSYRKSPSEP